MTVRVCARVPIVLLCAVCFASTAFAQTSWMRAYGGTGNEEGRAVKQTADGGYVLVGLTSSFGPGTPDSQNVYLIKTNASGDTLWTRVYGGMGTDVGTSLDLTSDGGYIVAGYTSSFGEGGLDVYLIKTDSLGDTLWTRTYGGTNTDCAYSVEQTADGGYAIAGFTFSSGVMGDFYLIKTDSAGDTLWTRIYGGSDMEFGNCLQQTADSGYIITGQTYSLNAGSSDIYLVRTDPSGDTVWTRTYGDTTSDDVGNAVQQTAEGGYIIAGYTNSFDAESSDVYLVKTNAQGETLWTRTYGGHSPDHGSMVRQTPDSGFIVVGATESFGAGSYDAYLIKTNASGDALWTKTYGGTRSDGASSVELTSDGGYIVAGYISSHGAGASDAYLIKTDSTGYAPDGIHEPLTRGPARTTRLLVRPNPFTSFGRVPGHETELFALSDVTGRQVATCRGDRIGEGLRPGVYFLSPVGSEVGKTARTTIVKAAY